MPEKKKTRLTWLPYLILLLAVLLAAYLVDLNDLIRVLENVRWDSFVLGAVCMVIGLILIYLRWWYLLSKSVGFSKVFYSDSISYMIRMFTPIFLPVLRVVTLTRITPLTISQATPPMMAERLFELLMRFLAIAFSIALVYTTRKITGLIIIWALLLALIIYGLERLTSHAGEYMPRIRSMLKRLPRLKQEQYSGPLQELGEGLQTLGSRTRLTVGLLFSVGMWGFFLVAQALLLDALRFNLNTNEALAVSAVILVAVPPSSPAMVGIYQSVMIALLAPFDFAEGNRLLAYSIVVFAVQAIFWVATGMWSKSRTHLGVREMIKITKSSDKPDD